MELLGWCSRCSRGHRGCTGGCTVDVRNQETQMNPWKPREAMGQILQPAVQCAVHLSRGDVGVPSGHTLCPTTWHQLGLPWSNVIVSSVHVIRSQSMQKWEGITSPVFFFLRIVLLLPTKIPGKWGCDKIKAPRTCRDCSPCRPKPRIIKGI